VIERSLYVKNLLEGKGSLDSVRYIANELEDSIESVFNGVAIEIAIKFQNDSMSFDDADFAINELWSSMVEYISASKQNSLPELAYSIYDAFDQGEYQHSNEIDPIETFTKPMLATIFKTL